MEGTKITGNYTKTEAVNDNTSYASLKHEREVVEIINKQGMHARPAGLFAEIASKYDGFVGVRNGRDPAITAKAIHGKEYADATSIIALLTLVATKGSKLEIIAEGENPKPIVKELVEIVNNGFYEQ